MEISKETLKKLLVSPGHISEEEFSVAQEEAEMEREPIEDILIEKGLITDEQLGQLIANFLKLPFIDLSQEVITEEVIKTVPELVARNQRIIVFGKTKKGLRVAMADPNNLEMIEWLEKKTGERIIPYYATPTDISKALKHYRAELKKTFEEIIAEQVKQVKEGKVKVEDVPIIKIVDTIIEYAFENNASDIHIEPIEKETQVRFRIDGVLHNVLTLPRDIHGLVVTRVKVLAKLRTDEHFAAQDGKFVAKFDSEKFDIRVSIVPVTEGEKIVMRLLSERVRRFNLEDLGTSEKELKKILIAIKKPYGMILATGPTGCGKTTTIYAILKILNKPEVNICTIEDPVEYDIEGVSQIQVNPKSDLTFSKGLRSIVRQDPDIIMVGEIRDEETAGIAINSAMTGHLVLSTMHANTASTNLIRLMDMGVEPFLAASSINLIIAQRLIRKICTKCRESYELRKEEARRLGLAQDLIKRFFGKEEKVRIYRGKGCRACVSTGYSGRIGIFEVLEIKDNIKELIMRKANADQIQVQAVKNGMVTMLEDGIDKVLSGISTIEEVIRVTRE